MKALTIQHRSRSRKARWQIPASYAERRLVHRFGFPVATARLVAELAYPGREAR